LQREGLAGVLPAFLVPDSAPGALYRVRFPALDECEFQYRLAWNPRPLRLNPHAGRRRDFLTESLAAQMRQRQDSAHS
jgi:DNA-binding transcriptional LysR family regulator